MALANEINIAFSLMVTGAMLFLAPEAQAFSRNRDLAEGCKQSVDFIEKRGPSRPLGAMCLGYLMGIREAVVVDNGRNYRACLPEEVTNEELIRVYLRWAENNPNRLHEFAFVGVIGALTEAYPCQ